MQIKRIDADGFMGLRGATLELPERGLVVVRGENGAGKSSLIEAVAVAFWGKTVRGTAPWREGEEGRVAVAAAVQALALVVERRVSLRGTKKLLWAPLGHPALDFDTQTKAQDALDSQLGIEFEVWRRCHVFSSQDAAHFTTATDLERKTLLERLLGLDRFDAALERCRAERTEAVRTHQLAEHAAAAARSRYNAARAALVAYDTAPLPELSPEPPDVAGRSSALEQEREEAERLHRQLRTEADALDRELRRADVARSRAALRVDDLQAPVSGLSCPACGYVIRSAPSGAEVDRAVADWQHRVNDFVRLESAERECVAKAQEVEERLRVLAREAQLLAGEGARHLAWLAEKARFDAARAQRAERRATLLGELSAAEAAYSEAEDRTAETARALAVLEHAQIALGPAGVRALMLGRALAGIEEAANAWMAQIARPDFRLRLRPVTTRKSGALAEAISLEVEGAGGGLGYRAASGGERRRIDVALLFALAEVSAAAFEQRPGTLFVDEVFDALDADGTAAVAGALGTLAENRCVVVITHSEDLAAQLPAASVRVVQDGRIR